MGYVKTIALWDLTLCVKNEMSVYVTIKNLFVLPCSIAFRFEIVLIRCIKYNFHNSLCLKIKVYLIFLLKCVAYDNKRLLKNPSYFFFSQILIHVNEVLNLLRYRGLKNTQLFFFISVAITTTLIFTIWIARGSVYLGNQPCVRSMSGGHDLTARNRHNEAGIIPCDVRRHTSAFISRRSWVR